MFAPPDPSSPPIPLPDPAGAMPAPLTFAPTLAATPAVSPTPALPPTPAAMPVATPASARAPEPAPTLAAPAAPPAPAVGPSPTLPPVGAGFTPVLPGTAPTPLSPSEPAAAGAVPNSVSVTPDTCSSAPARIEERPCAPARLFGTTWLRRIVIWANAAAVPGFFVGDAVGAALALLSVAALVVWSAVVATNVRRARPATRHGRAPHPAMVVFSWFVAPIFGVFAFVSIVSVSLWAASGTFDQQDGRMMVLVLTVGTAGIGMLIALYQPYRVLARCAKWVNADSGRFTKWFAAPIIAALIAGVLQILIGLVVLSDGADGSSSTASIGAAALWVVSFTLPWLAWLFFAGRAMRALESGVTHAHGRARREAQDPADVDPSFVGQAVAGMPPLSAPSA